MAGLGRPLGLGLCLVLGCTQAPAPPDSGPAGPPDLGVKAAVVVPPGRPGAKPTEKSWSSWRRSCP
jgi:hypothetical protein